MGLFQLPQWLNLGWILTAITLAGIVGALIAVFVVKKTERKEKLDSELNKTQSDLIGAQSLTIKNRDDRITDYEARCRAYDARIAELLTDKADMLAEYQTLMTLYVKDRIQQVAFREENLALHSTLEAMRAEIARRGGDPFAIERAAMEALKLSLGALAGQVLKGQS